MNLSDKQPVSDFVCEQIVIGTILTKYGAFETVSEYLTEDCFADNKHKEFYIAISALRDRGEKIDIITVNAELRKHNSRYTALDVADVAEHFVIDNLVPYAIRLEELSKRRKLWVIGLSLVKAGTDEVEDIDKAQQQTIESIKNLVSSLQGVFTFNDACTSLLDIIAKNMSPEGGMTGTFTGLRRLDGKGGLQGSDLIIVAGETSMGKSSLALSIAKNAISRDHKIAMYSMEMTKEQLAARMIASESNIPANDILYGSMTQVEWIKINQSISQIKGENLFFDDKSTSNIESILTSIRYMKLKYDIQGAIIDYLQILNVNMSSKSYSREQVMGDVARRLKNLAKELNIWVMALSQLNRNSGDPVPNLNRLRDSGQIAEAADVVMLIYRPSYYGLTYPGHEDIPTQGTAMIDVAKGRNIGTFKFFVGFDNNTTTFRDMEFDLDVEGFDDGTDGVPSPF